MHRWSRKTTKHLEFRRNKRVKMDLQEARLSLTKRLSGPIRAAQRLGNACAAPQSAPRSSRTVHVRYMHEAGTHVSEVTNSNTTYQLFRRMAS